MTNEKLMIFVRIYHDLGWFWREAEDFECRFSQEYIHEMNLLSEGAMINRLGDWLSKEEKDLRLERAIDMMYLGKIWAPTDRVVRLDRLLQMESQKEVKENDNC
tara:strand:+ start:330 stop:641 length:312 start_codon:yes stop_codon:yes gene_type:complete